MTLLLKDTVLLPEKKKWREYESNVERKRCYNEVLTAIGNIDLEPYLREWAEKHGYKKVEDNNAKHS